MPHSAAAAKPTVTPLHANVLVEDVGPMDRSPSGLYMAPDWKEVPREGKVLAAGPGPQRQDGTHMPLEVAPGDRIVYGRFAGRRVNLDLGAGHKEYIMMEATSILGILI